MKILICILVSTFFVVLTAHHIKHIQQIVAATADTQKADKSTKEKWKKKKTTCINKSYDKNECWFENA